MIDFPFDVFLSHSSLDKGLIGELAERLKRDGVKVWLDEWEVFPGGSVTYAVQKGLKQSRMLVICMSRNSDASEWVAFEQNSALFQTPVGHPGRIIALKLDDSEPREQLTPRQYTIDWRDRSVAAYGQLLGLLISSRHMPIAPHRTHPGDPDEVSHDQQIPSDGTNELPSDSECPSDGGRSEYDPYLDHLARMVSDRTPAHIVVDLKPLNSRGKSVVFRAQDQNLRRQVSVKVPFFHPGESREVLYTFLRKMRLVSQLKHENILSVYAGLERSGLPMLIQEFVAGLTLEQLLDRIGPLPLTRVRGILKDILSALEYAKELRSMHHRLSPGKIMIDAAGKPVLTPFRLIADGDEYFEPDTFQYQHPDRLKAFNMDPALGDVYSLKLIAYEMLTGRQIVNDDEKVNQEERTRNRQRPGILRQSAIDDIDNKKTLRDIGITGITDLHRVRNPIRRLKSDIRKSKSRTEPREETTEAKKQLKTVQASFEKWRRLPEFFNRFYDRLREDSDIDQIFRKNDDHPPERRHWMLREALDLLINYYHGDDYHFSVNNEVLKKIQVSHKDYGVGKEHYRHFICSLVATVNDIQQRRDGDHTVDPKELEETGLAWSELLTDRICAIYPESDEKKPTRRKPARKRSRSTDAG